MSELPTSNPVSLWIAFHSVTGSPYASPVPSPGAVEYRRADETKAERPVRFDLSRSDYDEWSMCPDGTGDYVRWEDVKQFFESSVVEPSAPQTRPCGCIKGCINCAYTGRIEIPAVNGTRDEPGR